MFKHFKQKEKQLSKMISQKFETIADYDMYNFNNCVKCTFEVSACDGNTYYIIAKTTPLLSVMIKIQDVNNVILEEIELSGEIQISESGILKFHLGNVNNTNKKYQHLGFGTLMFQAMLKTIAYYEKLYGFEFITIYGALGTEGKSRPQESIPLYLSFDNYQYSDEKKLYLKKETLNEKDCEIFYKIA